MRNVAMGASASERDNRDKGEQPREAPQETRGLAMIDCAKCGAHAEQLHLGCDLCEDCCDCRPG
jgi:hypothetical protein